MVALQILVLTVGVRILLGELKTESEMVQFFYARLILKYVSAANLAPSNIGLVHRPLKAERRVRLPWELKRIILKKTRCGESFFMSY